MSKDHSTHTAPENLVIVIGRQFGSGGRRIGKLIAERLGISYYDKELLSEAACSLGYAPEIFAAADEKKPSVMRSVLQGVYGIADNFHTTSMSGERLYERQSEIIRKIGDMGDCVIVGRTADYVLRDKPGLVSVFMHATIEHRARMIVERRDSMTIDNAIELARKHDHNRESYYNYFTGRNWGRASNYHITIDASAISDSDTADLIISYAKAKMKSRTRK